MVGKRAFRNTSLQFFELWVRLKKREKEEREPNVFPLPLCQFNLKVNELVILSSYQLDTCEKSQHFSCISRSNLPVTCFLKLFSITIKVSINSKSYPFLHDSVSFSNLHNWLHFCLYQYLFHFQFCDCRWPLNPCTQSFSVKHILLLVFL